ncbi:MAG: c-type cytochrome domain-containing protein, partial [bacterium]
MTIPSSTQNLLLFCFILFSPILVAAEKQELAWKAESLTFEKDIRPILRAHCLDCHGGVEGAKGKLDLRLVRTMTSGGKNGPAMKPGHADESLIVARIE